VEPGTPLDDATLVSRARDGDVRAYEQLVLRYQAPMFRLVSRVLTSRGDAEDVVQEVFVTAWRRLPQLTEDAAFVDGLYRTTTNRCLNVIRARRPRVDAEVSTGSEAQPEHVALTSALRELTPEQRACRLLCEVHGRSYEEIAETEQPPPDLLGRIMSAVRAEARRGQMLGLPTPEPGTVEVSEQAVAVVLRYAADAVGGVRARRCRVRTAGVGEAGESLVEVELTLAISMGNASGGEALAKVRERVSAAAAARVGLRLVELDLVVDDIYEVES
jgi:RNA polymerase sigma-70 factor (ECF subfamily)